MLRIGGQVRKIKSAGVVSDDSETGRGSRLRASAWPIFFPAL